MTYPILPPERTWPTPVEEIAQRLVDRLDHGPTDRAALYLLMRTPTDWWATDNAADAAADGWPVLADILTADVDEDTDRAGVLDLVCTLAMPHVGLWGLGDILTRITAPHRDAFIDAARLLGGAR